MANTSTESVTREYIDNFSVKKGVEENLIPKYFEGQDVSDLNVGMLGLTTELISDGFEDVFNSVSTLYEEQFSNRAKMPSSILSHAAVFQLSNGMSTSATCEFILILKEQYVINNKEKVIASNGGASDSYVFYIDKDTKILVEDKIFSLDYDIAIYSVLRESSGGYIYSAQYVMDKMKNSISDVNTPYINIQKIGPSNIRFGGNAASENYLTLKITCHQIRRVIKYEEIINNTKINFPSFDIPFDGQLAGFDVMYKASDSTEYNQQLIKLNKYSAPIADPYCYYSLTDENVLTISFGNNDAYFQPDFNSEIEITLYITDGAEGNFDEYTGFDISVATTSDNYSYNDNFFVMAKVMSAASNGKDARTLEELQALTVEGFRTANVYSTENDIEEYFNNYPYRYGNECKFIKKRDDMVDRLYSGFIVMKRNDYIYPTNTLYISSNVNKLINTDTNKYVIDTGALFTYDAEGNAVFIENPYFNSYLPISESNLPYYTIYDLTADTGRRTQTGAVVTLRDALVEQYKFVYTNPFMMSISTKPNLVGSYLTMVNQTVALDFVNQSIGVFEQFVATTAILRRYLDSDRKYTLETSIFPSATITQEIVAETDEDGQPLPTDEDGYGDDAITTKNLVRLVAVIEDYNGTELCFFELKPQEKTTDGTYRFAGSFETDDHVTTSKYFRIIDGVIPINFSGEILAPMADAVVNIYILVKSDGGVTDNPFYSYDESYEGYVWSNKYSTKNYPLTFIRPMNMVRTDLTYLDYNLTGGQAGDVTISSVPLIGVDDVFDYLTLNSNPQTTIDELADTNFNYFITSFTNQYAHLEDIVDSLLTSTNLDIKFYNTYGRSNNFIIGDEVDGEELIDTINITIRYYIWVVSGTDQVKAESELKQFIKEYIEKINKDGTNSFYNSNLIRTIENKFVYVHHIKFIGINEYKDADGYATKYQSIKNVTVDLDTINKLERIKYVPEVLVANLDHIELTFFDAT